MKVEKALVDEVMRNVVVKVHRFPGTTTTVAAVFRDDGFMLATGVSNCVDPTEDNPMVGEAIAVQNAMQEAETQAWRIEGIRLKDLMNAEAASH